MTQIDFQHTGISSLLKDYLAQDEGLFDFYSLFPTEENYHIQAEIKLQDYQHRNVLTHVLSNQMCDLTLNDKQKHHLDILSNDNCVTITTGHQLNLLSGPLYFIYKILHTVKICDVLNQKNSGIDYVPIYWMATEDHDFEEINHFNTYDQTVSYQANDGGFVGDIPSNTTHPSLKTFLQELPNNSFGQRLKEIVQKAYWGNHDLGQATRVLVHELLGEFGILILDGNSPELKKLMHPIFKNELLQNPTQPLVEETNRRLEQYKNQAYAREINLFYLNNDKRERIEKINNEFHLVESGITFSEEEILNELTEYPEKFSPNVILRPLYQEVILPNVAYIGGGGELAYWLQLKSVFEHNHVPFPMLVLRNSMVLLPNAYKHKAETYDLLNEKIFKPNYQLKRKITAQQSELFQSLEELEQTLSEQFTTLEGIAEKTTDSFRQMVNAQKQKQMNGFAKMYDRLHKAEQERFRGEIDKIDEIYDYIFPHGNWQERIINFSEFYLSNGSSLFEEIYNQISPFESVFNILCLNSIAKK